MRSGEIKIILLFAGFALAVIGISVAMTGSKKDQARRILEQQGIEVTSLEYGFFGCGQDDTYNFKFKGTNERGYVEGRVCSGLMKGATVRYN